MTGSPSALAAVLTEAEALSGMLLLARALAESNRRIDLAGLDQRIGRLCAAALDLPAQEGRQLRPHLKALLAAAARLEGALSSVLSAPALPH